MKKTHSETLQEILRLIEMNDTAFAEEFLAELSPEELEEFQKRCPDFPPEHLPKHAL